jgi:hypothetical protein
MKRYFLFGVILLLGFVLAEPGIYLQHEDITKGETIIGMIKIEGGRFLENIRESDVKFYEGRKEIFFEYDIFFFENIFYFYAYTTRLGNFTMKIDRVLYEKGGMRSANLEKNFEVREGSSSLTIKPGIIYLEKQPKIKLINSGETPLNLTYSGNNKIGLSPGQDYEVSYTPITNLSLFEISGYKKFLVPVISTIKNDTFIPVDKINLRFNTVNILTNLNVGEKVNETIEFFNFANESISNIAIKTNLDFIKFDEIKSLGEKEARNVTIYFEPKREGHFNDRVNISYVQAEKEYFTEIFLNLYVFKNGTNTTFSEESCEQKYGNVCKLNEICDGVSEWTVGGVYCCLGECRIYEEDPKESSGWIWGVLIILGILVIGVMIYNKYKKTARKNPEDKMKELNQKFENKFK